MLSIKLIKAGMNPTASPKTKNIKPPTPLDPLKAIQPIKTSFPKIKYISKE